MGIIWLCHIVSIVAHQNSFGTQHFLLLPKQEDVLLEKSISPTITLLIDSVTCTFPARYRMSTKFYGASCKIIAHRSQKQEDDMLFLPACHTLRYSCSVM